MYQIHYDPTSTPVANVVTKFISGAVNESDPQPPNTLRGGEDLPVVGVEHLRDKPFKYLKVDTSRVLVMSREERDAVDAARAAKDDEDAEAERFDSERLARALAKLLVIRNIVTKDQVIAAYKQTQ